LTQSGKHERVANRTIHGIILVGALAFATVFSAAANDETFPTLTIGEKTFTNVLVLNKTRTDVFLSHSKGMASYKVKELPEEVQLKLGYQVEQPRGAKAAAKAKDMLKAADLSRFESDPRVKEIQEQVLARFREVTQKMDPTMIWGILGGAVLIYLVFCALCRSICTKSATPPGLGAVALVWFPLLKQIPLLKAAGMSPWWFLSNFVPLLPLIMFIVWSFKIVKARGKPVIVGILLLLPVLNVFAFLYLALSASNAPENNTGVISLQSSPRRQAA
jgi:hypothetical protein